MEKLKLKDAPGWVKDSTSKAVLNTDKSSLEEYKINRRKNMLINNMENKEIALVYMVAGMSSRFGGKIKQFAKVGPNKKFRVYHPVCLYKFQKLFFNLKFLSQ